MVSEPTYPKRPSHFDREFVRAMIDRSAANTIGPDGFALLTIIVDRQDRAREHYAPVSFWSGQLMMALGVSEDTLCRIRKRCVEAGWLHHTPGAKAKAARYYVTMPGEMTPQVAEETGVELPSLRNLRPQPAEGIVFTPQVADASCGGIAEESKENARDIPPCPNPNPKYTASRGSVASEPAKTPTRKTAPESDARFAKFWAAYPKKVAKPAASRAFARHVPDDDTLQAVLDAIAKQQTSAEWRKSEGDFIPYPATWINNRRWEDVLPSMQPTAPTIKTTAENIINPPSAEPAFARKRTAA